jgi:hypothetical protein
MKPLRILVVSDIHHNPVDGPPKLCSQALSLLERTICGATPEECDLMVDLGDRIDERGADRDEALAREVAALFQPLRVPRVHLMGNHDSYFLGRDRWSHILEQQVCSQTMDVGGYRLVFFCPDVNNQRGLHDYSLRPSELEWLAHALRTELPTLIFSHVPLLAGPLFGNYYFEGKRGRAEFLNAADARALIAPSNTILCISGHVHWNTWHALDGVHYVTVQSLTESFTTHPYPAGAATLIELGEAITIDVRGRDPMRLRLRPREGGRCWLGRA